MESYSSQRPGAGEGYEKSVADPALCIACLTIRVGLPRVVRGPAPNPSTTPLVRSSCRTFDYSVTFTDLSATTAIANRQMGPGNRLRFLQRL
jgi:hypothetical protein